MDFIRKAYDKLLKWKEQSHGESAMLIEGARRVGKSYISKRFAENQKYLNFRRNFKSNISQFFVRLKNIRKYRYFRCPECKARLRLPRKVGEVTVTCGKCRHQFRQKA